MATQKLPGAAASLMFWHLHGGSWMPRKKWFNEANEECLKNDLKRLLESDSDFMDLMNTRSIDIIFGDPQISQFRFHSIQRMWMTGDEYWEQSEADEDVGRGEMVREQIAEVEQIHRVEKDCHQRGDHGWGRQPLLSISCRSTPNRSQSHATPRRSISRLIPIS